MCAKYVRGIEVVDKERLREAGKLRVRRATRLLHARVYKGILLKG